MLNGVCFAFICIESLIVTKTDFLVYFSSYACWALVSYLIVLISFKFRKQERAEKVLEANGDEQENLGWEY